MIASSECYDGDMRTVSALDVRKHFGKLLDEASAGERIVIERAGQPQAVLVPLDVLDMIDPDRELARKREALAELQRLARLRPFPAGFDSAGAIRQMRNEREAQIVANVRSLRTREP